MEEFRDIKGTDGVYQISDLGRVKSFKGKTDKILTGSTGKVYRRVHIQKQDRNIHVLVAEAFLGHTPCGYKTIVDHIDENPLNNRLDNLQLLSHRNNIAKGFKSKGGTSKHVGVHWNKKADKWKACIKFKGKNRYLGLFTCELEASNAYEKALNEIK